VSQLSKVQNDFLDLLLSSGALRFGSFKTKSGRISPYFLNTGAFDHGGLLSRVGVCYAAFIAEKFPQERHLYGPAYKGITLAAATAMELARITGREVPFTFNRKEAKDHGEGGVFVGRDLRAGASVLIIEDVMTGGTSIRETMAILTPRGVRVAAVIVGVDRQERGQGANLAAIETTQTFACSVAAILTIDEIIAELWDGTNGVQRLGQVWIDGATKAQIDAYRCAWGST
jgi:orotate phosphoribosyltransferase